MGIADFLKKQVGKAKDLAVLVVINNSLADIGCATAARASAHLSWCPRTRGALSRLDRAGTAQGNNAECNAG